MYFRSERVTVAERLSCSPPTKTNRVPFPAGSFPDFRWDSRQTMPLVGALSWGYHVSLPFIAALLHTQRKHPHRLSRPRWTAGNEMLDSPPSTKVNRAQSPAGSLLDFRWESRQTMPLVSGFPLKSPTIVVCNTNASTKSQPPVAQSLLRRRSGAQEVLGSNYGQGMGDCHLVAAMKFETNDIPIMEAPEPVLSVSRHTHPALVKYVSTKEAGPSFSTDDQESPPLVKTQALQVHASLGTIYLFPEKKIQDDRRWKIQKSRNKMSQKKQTTKKRRLQTYIREVSKSQTLFSFRCVRKPHSKEDTWLWVICSHGIKEYMIQCLSSNEWVHETCAGVKALYATRAARTTYARPCASIPCGGVYIYLRREEKLVKHNDLWQRYDAVDESLNGVEHRKIDVHSLCDQEGAATQPFSRQLVVGFKDIFPLLLLVDLFFLCLGLYTALQLRQMLQGICLPFRMLGSPGLCAALIAGITAILRRTAIVVRIVLRHSGVLSAAKLAMSVVFVNISNCRKMMSNWAVTNGKIFKSGLVVAFHFKRGRFPWIIRFWVYLNLTQDLILVLDVLGKTRPVVNLDSLYHSFGFIPNMYVGLQVEESFVPPSSVEVNQYHENDFQCKCDILPYLFTFMDNIPVDDRHFKCPPPKLKAFREITDILLTAVVIVPSKSDYCSPGFLVSKYRLVSNHSKVNKKIHKDLFPLPAIDSALQHLGKARIFSLFLDINPIEHLLGKTRSSCSPSISFVTHTSIVLGYIAISMAPDTHAKPSAPESFPAHLAAVHAAKSLFKVTQIQYDGWVKAQLVGRLVPASDPQPLMPDSLNYSTKVIWVEFMLSDIQHANADVNIITMWASPYCDACLTTHQHTSKESEVMEAKRRGDNQDTSHKTSWQTSRIIYKLASIKGSEEVKSRVLLRQAYDSTRWTRRWGFVHHIRDKNKPSAMKSQPYVQLTSGHTKVKNARPSDGAAVMWYLKVSTVFAEQAIKVRRERTGITTLYHEGIANFTSLDKPLGAENLYVLITFKNFPVENRGKLMQHIAARGAVLTNQEFKDSLERAGIGSKGGLVNWPTHCVLDTSVGENFEARPGKSIHAAKDSAKRCHNGTPRYVTATAQQNSTPTGAVERYERCYLIFVELKILYGVEWNKTAKPWVARKVIALDHSATKTSRQHDGSVVEHNGSFVEYEGSYEEPKGHLCSKKGNLLIIMGNLWSKESHLWIKRGILEERGDIFGVRGTTCTKSPFHTMKHYDNGRTQIIQGDILKSHINNCNNSSNESQQVMSKPPSSSVGTDSSGDNNETVNAKGRISEVENKHSLALNTDDHATPTKKSKIYIEDKTGGKYDHEDSIDDNDYENSVDKVSEQ
ncbi:hypothetical protein PR048_013405 [Dryococelus australis]|uniref:Uncharacterized protein n=1 Tax=Dryococelus australis TaxID=614101 RepID=A0ABQ9HS26_9NEOP|nr:hypothetical protein PR048_013405 [Dryococelus australis]